jgi:hypothetical protein
MPFTSFPSIGDVARAYQITLRDADFVEPLERPPSDMLRQQLAFAREFAAYNISESAVCEYLIHPGCSRRIISDFREETGLLAARAA